MLFMETVVETTKTTAIPRQNSLSKTNGKVRVRSEESINRFLLKHDRYEYVRGRFEKKSMPNAKHSGIATRISGEIFVFLKTHNIGRVYNEAHFQIGEDKRIPDVAFVEAAKIPATGEPQQFWDFAPDLAIEIVSPTDFYQNVLIKIDDYFAAKVKQVWLINPEKETLTIYFSPKETKVLSKSDALTCEEILPKFSLKLSDIFVD
jgi:Uma2 family endonuclease